MLQSERRYILPIVLTLIVGGAGLCPSIARSQSNSDLAIPQLNEKKLQLLFTSAQGFLERESYNNAIPLLQAILNQSQDAMIPIDPANPSQSVSLKGEVLRAVRTLPRGARQSYNLQYNAEARDLLQQAQVGTERSILEEIVRRFFYTDTGLDASFRLANLYFDRGEYFSAGLMFERLLEDGRISRRYIPRILFQEAICWHQSDLIEKSQEALVRLKSVAQGEEFSLAGQTLKVFEEESESIGWLQQYADLTDGAGDHSRVRNWLTFRGNGGRNASSDPVMPLREKKWEFRTIPLAETPDPRKLELVEQSLRSLVEQFQDTSFLTFPAYHPLVIGDKIIFRSLDHIKAVDMASGELIWENFLDDSKLEKLLESPLENFSLSDSRISEVQKYVMQRCWRDLSSGQLSSDGEIIYAIEQQGLVEGDYDIYGRTARPEKNNENQLVAYQIRNGKTIWGLGGAGTPYAGGVFLGVPLVQGQEFYCLFERETELQLLAFQNRISGSGKIVPVELWSQPLSVSSAHEESIGDPLRRISGLSPTYSNGLLICPTGRGTIIAYDLAHRIFSWRYEYQDAPLRARTTISSLNTLRQNHGIGPDDESRWIDPTPVAAGSRLFVTPTDSDSLYCIDAFKGNLLWTVPREDDLYLACVHQNAVVLVGREKIHALDAQDGEELWSIPISLPSGRGYLADGRYFVPLSSAAIACIDLKAGELLATVPSDYSRVPGNLIAAGGSVISLSSDRLFCYETAIPSTAKSAAALLELQGKQKLFEGRMTEAIDLLLEANKSEPTTARRLLLTELMFDAVRRDIAENSKFLDPLAEFTRGTPEAKLLDELLAEGYQKSGQNREAFDLFLKLARLPSKEIERKNHRIRSDVWSRAHLEELYRTGTDADRTEFDKLLDQTIAAIQDPVSSSDLLQLIEGLPGRETLLLQRINRIDPYTETLAFEQALLRLQHSALPELRREGLAKHFKWLMKLDRIAEAALLRDRLLAESADQICLDGQTGAELVRWGEENQKLADYLKWRDYKWPAGPPRLIPVSSNNSRNDQTRGLFTPIAGDPGLFRGWRFEYVVNNSRRLLGFDPFGNQQIEVPVTYRSRSPYQLNYDRKIHLHGHLAVLEFFDHYFVFDLFQNGELAFRHGPHQLMRPLAGVETPSPRNGKTQVVTAPNGQREVEVVDLFDQPFGQVGLVTDEMIVHQAGRWLISIDSLSGKTRWQRQLPARGQHLFGDRDVVCVLPPEGQVVSQYRALDGTQIGEYDAGPFDRILGKIGSQLIVQSNGESRSRIVCHDVARRQVLWQIDCERESLFQKINTTELAILERSGRLRVMSLRDGSPIAQMQLAPPPQPPLEELNLPAEVRPVNTWEAFWVQPFTEGWLIITKESILENDPAIRVAQFPDSVEVEGEVAFLRRDGQVQWNKRIKRQGFSIMHPFTSPVIVLCVKQYPVRGQFVRLPQNSLVQLIDLATGEAIGPQSDNFQHNGFQIVVVPAESRAEVLSSKSSHSVVFGPDEVPPEKTPPSSNP